METCPQCEGNPQHVAIMCEPGGCRETVLSCDFCVAWGSLQSKQRIAGAGDALCGTNGSKLDCPQLKARLLGVSRSSSKTKSRTVAQRYQPDCFDRRQSREASQGNHWIYSIQPI